MTPDLTEAASTAGYWIVILATVLIVGLTIGLHYEALQRLNQAMPRWNLARHPRVLVMMFCILAVHIAEIWLFGVGIYLIVQMPELGRVVGAEPLGLLDAVYASATAYSTLGYGDLVPQGAVRVVFGTEALVGLLMITWSASFAYLEMARYWRT